MREIRVTYDAILQLGIEHCCLAVYSHVDVCPQSLQKRMGSGRTVSDPASTFDIQLTQWLPVSKNHAILRL